MTPPTPPKSPSRPPDDPRRMSLARRRHISRMLDAMRMVERDLHFRLWDLGTIPEAWHRIELDPPCAYPKRGRITAQFDEDVLRYFRGLGAGYQARMNLVLRAYVHGRLAQIVEGPDTTDWILHPERIPDWPEEVHWGDAERDLGGEEPPAAGSI